METTQDRTIREKLNSLETLPEGYAPSLDSKWELLMAGQPEPKKQMPFLWFAAAASLLLLLGFGFLFLKDPNHPEKTTIAQTNPSVPSPKTVAFSPEKPENAPKVAASNKPEAQEEIIVKNARPEPVKTKTTGKEIAKALPVSNSEPKIQNPEPVVLTSEPAPTLVAIESPKLPRKKKSTFVEMDFDSPQPAKIIRSQNQTAQINFKIKLLPQENNAAFPVVQNEKPLRLQHTF